MDEELKKGTRRKKIKKLAFEDPKGTLVWAMLIVFGITGFVGFLVNLVFLKLGYSFDVTFVNTLITVLTMVLIAPISLGFMSLFLKNSRDQIYTLNDIFSQIKNSPKYILLYALIMFGYTIITGLLSLIPVVGFFINFIIFILFMPIYFIVPFVYLDNKDLKIKEIISKAFDIIGGRRTEFYGMICSFGLWFVLGIFTLGFLYFWILPYLYISITYLYLYWTQEKEFEKEKGLSNGHVLLITIGFILIFSIVMIVNVPSTLDNMKSVIIGEKITRAQGDTELSYGGAKVSFDAPNGYTVMSKTDATITYVKDNNILQYTVYLNKVDDTMALDKEVVKEMRETGEYKHLTDEEFSFKAGGKKVKGYMYKATDKNGKKSSIVVAYYPVGSFVVTVSLSNSIDGNLNKEDIEKFVNIY